MGKKESISRIVEGYRDVIIGINDQIWEFAEPGMREYRSSSYLAEVFRRQGFKVETGLAGIPTAFVAAWGHGKPAVGFLGEFDALPNLSQKAAWPERSSLAPGAWGHGCGHNSLGARAARAALALRDYARENGIACTVRFYGCPGEEFGSGKAFMAREGLFDDLDACFTWHPASINVVVGKRNLACLSVFYIFRGKSAHAAASPHHGRSALDACELMSVGVNYLREHMPPDARVHYAYVDAGGAAPNVVQDYAKVNYFIRSPEVSDMMDLFERVTKVARGAAMMTETAVECIIHEGASNYLPSRTLDKITQRAFEKIGGPAFDQEDMALAARFRETCTRQEIDEFFKYLEHAGASPEMISKDSPLFTALLPYVAQDRGSGASTDVGDVSHCVPTSQIEVATVAVGTPDHSWQLTAQSRSPIAYKGIVTAAKVMALAAAMAIEDEEALRVAKRELLEKTGGKYRCPFPDSVKPTL